MNRPWMPLYVADYLADTGHLSTAEHGAYMLLIMHYWQNGSLPEEERRIARIARMSQEEWADSRDTLADLFDEGWKHKRIEAEMARAEDVSSKRKAAAEQRHSKRNSNAPANAEQLHAQSQSQSHTEKVDATASTSPEPDKSAPVAVIGLPTVSEGDYPVFEADIAEWFAAFPAVDVMQQLAAARSWLMANPKRRKTKRGMRRFIVSWLDRRQNSGVAPIPRATAPPGKLTPKDAYNEIARERGWPTDEPEILPSSDQNAHRLRRGDLGHEGTVVDLRRGSDWRVG